MKRRKSTEPDLYVINQKPTKQELKELRTFIEEHQRKQAAKKMHRSAA